MTRMAHASLTERAGLTQGEATARLAAEGHNELPAARPRGLSGVVREVVREPMFKLLAAAGGIYLLIGDVREALVLLAAVFVVMGITIYQERKSERALEALRDLSSPRALVMRDGVATRIAGREVVRGDVLIVKEGDRVPADAVMLKANDLRADESLLTGESVPVRKVVWNGSAQLGRAGGDDLPFVFSGTLLVQGQGTAEVLATGAATELGKIGRALTLANNETTPLQRQTAVVVRRLALLAISLCVLVVLIHGFARGNWLDGLLAGITLAIAILPGEFPMVLTVFLALGAWRISQRGVLTRRMPAIEALGAATVLCVDKTGTLTLNRMTVRQLWVDGRFVDVTEIPTEAPAAAVHALTEVAVLACEVDPLDPMEKAIVQFGDAWLGERQERHAGWELVKEYPLSEDLLAHTHGWSTGGDADHTVATKGAPEAVARLCHLTPAELETMHAALAQMAARGLRVLGVARGTLRDAQWPLSPHAIEFAWLGLIGLEDPVRPTVAAAVRECRAAGIRVVMITGDYPATALAIAAQAGIPIADGAVTGAEIEAMDAAALGQRIQAATIFARVAPVQKLRLIEAFKAAGEVVAMTGDGVNDAPALKAAHIGIAMGGRGTDVAREAASLVLIHDDFDSIVSAVRLGRRIYRNIRNAMRYLLAVHVPTAGMAFLPLLFGWPVAFFPLHVVFIEFVIDPACSVAFEAEPADAMSMRVPPRASDAQLFDLPTLAISLLQGLGVFAAVALLYSHALLQGAGETAARTLAFMTIIMGNLALILTNRSESRLVVQTVTAPNPALWWVIGGALAALCTVLAVPALRSLFRLAAPSFSDVALSVVAAMASVLWFELYKLLRARRKAH
jgi:Ca2+-transporting ATPase